MGTSCCTTREDKKKDGEGGDAPVDKKTTKQRAQEAMDKAKNFDYKGKWEDAKNYDYKTKWENAKQYDYKGKGMEKWNAAKQVDYKSISKDKWNSALAYMKKKKENPEGEE